MWRCEGLGPLRILHMDIIIFGMHTKRDKFIHYHLMTYCCETSGADETTTQASDTGVLA
jgi:hypothetical protein